MGVRARSETTSTRVCNMTEVGIEIAEIRAMDLPSLRDEWRRHHRAPPPRRLSRDLLIRGIAYKSTSDLPPIMRPPAG